MGYTHYWTYGPGSAGYRNAWPQIVRDTAVILGHLGSSVALAGPVGTGAPTVDPAGIAFNGAVPHDYDTFELSAPAGGEPLWDFCKTGRRPYDIAVTAVLLRCHLLLPDGFRINSDGRWNSDWYQARALVQRLFDMRATDDPFTDTTAGLSPQDMLRRDSA
jgi:hypothetical protein